MQIDKLIDKYSPDVLRVRKHLHTLLCQQAQSYAQIRLQDLAE